MIKATLLGQQLIILVIYTPEVSQGLRSDFMLLTPMFRLLPPELRIVVYGYCELSSMKSLRLSCRTFEREINPMLFHTVVIDILPRGIEILRKITDHPYLVYHVQKLVISTNILRPFTHLTFRRKFCQFEHLAGEQTLPFSGRALRMYSRFKTLRRYHEYCRYLKWQKGVLLDRATLYSMIMKLATLNSMELRLSKHVEQSQGWNRFSNDLFGSGDDFDLGKGTTTTAYCDTHLCVAHSLLSEMNHYLTSLKIDFIPCSCWYFESFEIWRHLRRLSVCAEHGSTLEETGSVTAGLRNILLNIGLIEFLYLEITPSCNYSSRIDFGEIFADVQLTVLQCLDLSTGKVFKHDFIRIVKVHNSNLLQFNITDLHLVDGQWETVFTLLRECLHGCVAIFEGVTDGDGWSIRAAVPFGRSLKVTH